MPLTWPTNSNCQPLCRGENRGRRYTPSTRAAGFGRQKLGHCTIDTQLCCKQNSSVTVTRLDSDHAYSLGWQGHVFTRARIKLRVSPFSFVSRAASRPSAASQCRVPRGIPVHPQIVGRAGRTSRCLLKRQGLGTGLGTGRRGDVLDESCRFDHTHSAAARLHRHVRHCCKSAWYNLPITTPGAPWSL